jgi:conjugal transfer/entry exclusion protein
MAYELEQLKKLVNKTQAQIDQKNYLETQIAELERDYTEKEESLISRAIKGTTIENKRAKMDIIYDKLH